MKTKKKAAKSSPRRAKKGAIKDLEAKSSPRGGGGGVPGISFLKVGDLIPAALKIDFYKP